MNQPVVSNEEVSAALNASIMKMAEQAKAQPGQAGNCQSYAQAAQCFSHAKATIEGLTESGRTSTSSKKSN